MELNIRVTGIINENEIDDIFLELSTVELKKIKVDSFSGLDVIIYLLTFGGGVTIIQIASIIKKIIDKNKIKSVKIGDIEIKGYSVKQTAKLLEQINKEKKN